MARPRRSSGGGALHCCLAFLFKFLAFLQAFAAVSVLLYAAWILSRWGRHHHLHLRDLLPDLWFVCALMAAGLFYCLLLLAGCVAAEINSACFLCFYTILVVIMMLLEAAVAADLFFNKNWIQDLPYDRTGELNNLLSFIQSNLDLCKWAAVAIVAAQAFSLLLATILRTMVSTLRADYDSDEDFVVIRRPLLVAQGAPAYLPTTVDSRGFHPDLWSSRMRQKYGLNSSSYTYNTLDPNAPPPQ
ncbi:tetraspanin-18-like [Oryza brachyantha]|uniref:Tetraspanin n=1 Tax=Oryza brachyantha TaxID=4533 RepID=J3MHW6_ORYBR|nr:tetraspanin-18-like [Oryza brachyantha]